MEKTDIMDLNIFDHQLFKNYITSTLQNNSTIELLINKNICNNLQFNNIPLDSDKYIHNLNMLLKYLSLNNIFISNWHIQSNSDLLNNGLAFKIFNILDNYFNLNNQYNNIVYFNQFNLSPNICNNLNEYFTKSNYTVSIPSFINLDYFNISNETLKFLDYYKEDLYVIINPNNNLIDKYKQFENIIKNYNNIYIKLITNQQVEWTDKQINEYIILLDYIIKQQYSIHKNNLLNYVLPFKDVSYQNNPIALSYFDKNIDNTAKCSLGKKLTIDCNDLSFPSCCGLQNSIFNGGKFLIKDNEIIDIIATEGINGYLNQKITNVFFKPDCMSCENKYFCYKGCPAAQFKINAEPYIPVKSLCTLENSRINFLIKTYDKLGFFDILLSNDLLNNDIKINLIKLLINKGYKQYEYKYHELYN